MSIDGHAEHQADDQGLDSFMTRWAEAIVANDIERMDGFVTPDWVLIDKPGPITRDTFHAAVSSGMLRHHHMTHDLIETRRLGHDVALLTTRGQNHGTFQGEPIEADEWTTNVLVRTADGWCCALTELTTREQR